MCIQNVNATCKTFAAITDKDGYLIYERPFDTLIGKRENNKLSVGKFWLSSDFMITATEQEDLKETNLILSKVDLKVIIRVTKMSANIESQEHRYLQSFIIKVNDDTIKTGACVPYVQANVSTEVDMNKLFGDNLQEGRYAIKILVQRDDAQDKGVWTVQTFSVITVAS